VAGDELSLEPPAIGSHNVPTKWQVGPNLVNDVLEDLRDTLKDIHDVAGNELNLDYSVSDRTVDKLLDLAYDVGYPLFREWPGNFYAAAEECAPGAFHASVAPRIVEVTAPPGFAYPFELLKWRDLPASWEARSDGPGTGPHEWWDLPEEARDDPAVRIRSLLGMSAIVRRGFTATAGAARPAMPGAAPAALGADTAPPEDDPLPPRNDPGPLDNDPVLPMTIFCNPELIASEKEIKYLKRAEKLIDLYGPWPEKGELAEMAAARYLMNPSTGFDGNPRDPVVTVLHLACHSNTTATAPNRHFLRLGGLYGDVPLRDLRRQLMTKEGAAARVRRPLVFLNACATAVPEPADRSSFTSFLLENGFRGVLGTLCDISDVVAAHFSVMFYEALLNGMTVGEAMYEARWHLMDKHRNPLGLFYTFYGNVDLRLSRSHKGEMGAACTLPPAKR
jgi:hypothetical protein